MIINVFSARLLFGSTTSQKKHGENAFISYFCESQLFPRLFQTLFETLNVIVS